MTQKQIKDILALNIGRPSGGGGGPAPIANNGVGPPGQMGAPPGQQQQQQQRPPMSTTAPNTGAPAVPPYNKFLQVDFLNSLTSRKMVILADKRMRYVNQ